MYQAPDHTDLESGPECTPSPQSENKNTWGPATNIPIEVDHPSNLTPADPEIEAITAAFDPIASLQGPLPLDPPAAPSGMSVNVTTTAPVTNPPLNGGMRGVSPAIFDGTWSHTNEFCSQFHQYKLVNCTHDSMVKPFNKVLTALTYIWGQMINNWVNSQEQCLTDQINMTKHGWVHKDNEILWQEFEMAFTMPGWICQKNKWHTISWCDWWWMAGTWICTLLHLTD